ASELYISPFPLVDVTVIPDDEIVRHRRVALLERIQKHIRQRDLMGIVEQLTTILLSGVANDRQLKPLFNYLLQTGHARRFGRFIHGVAPRVPPHRGRFMTIAERLQEVGPRKSKRGGQQAEGLRHAPRVVGGGLSPQAVGENNRPNR
ncbi:ISNCY family transposase, partial [Klebsiella pneumoniae]|uniref:Rpn family recombination-promoting nuclease/putative transposase n=1 Tax=Klebsiella pneumoniae TaxID=573 RepID=UPI00102645FC